MNEYPIESQVLGQEESQEPKEVFSESCKQGINLQLSSMTDVTGFLVSAGM